MSWQPYVDGNLVGSGKIGNAAIYGLDGGQWAASRGFALSPEEFHEIKAGFDDPAVLLAGGVHVAGTKYLAIEVDATRVHGKRGAAGVLAEKTKKAVVIGVYNENTQPGEANKVVGGVVDYLRSAGF
ncbi:profilin [Streptomyces sp. CT34]|uniref:profilin n=1 Tax=Streptomyces sp. CT34 TaxID=1553907 RepID=UPI0005BD7905|nr:profilin [Streptomyces sp. CT34]